MQYLIKAGDIYKYVINVFKILDILFKEKKSSFFNNINLLSYQKYL
jgi:hypothetical protein